MSEREAAGNGITVDDAGSEPTTEMLSAAGALAALGAALIWALLVVGFGHGISGWLVLSAGAALTLLSVQLAFRGLSRAGVWGRAVAYGAACALPLWALMAVALKQGTNHRPLGAVTFTVLALGIWLGAAWVVARLDLWRRILGFVSGGLMLGALVLWLVTAGKQSGALALQWGAGFVLAAGCVVADQRLRRPTWGGGFGMAAWGAVLLVNVALGLSGWSSSVDQAAPAVIGVLGLLR